MAIHSIFLSSIHRIAIVLGLPTYVARYVAAYSNSDSISTSDDPDAYEKSVDTIITYLHQNQ